MFILESKARDNKNFAAQRILDEQVIGFGHSFMEHDLGEPGALFLLHL